MQSSIKALRAEKKELLASVLKYEKDVLLMERKIQLEREMKASHASQQNNCLLLPATW